MRLVIRLLAAGMLMAALVMGQTSGTIQGTVTDDSGAVIPGAEVLVSSLDTGAESSVSTNEVGFYTIPGLNQGLYSVSCGSDGFSTKEFPEVRLEVQQTMRIDCALTVGSVTETVEVNAAAILIQSEKTEVGQVIDSKRILEMPLNGRNYLELAKFSVGVLPSREMGKGTRHDGVRGRRGRHPSSRHACGPNQRPARRRRQLVPQLRRRSGLPSPSHKTVCRCGRRV